MFGRGYEVVGVAAAGFNGVGQVPADFWIAQPPETHRGLVSTRTVVIRLRPGETRAQTEAAVLAWARGITSARVPEQRVVSVQLQSNSATLPMNAELVAAFVSIAAAFLLVLLLAAANVANMVLARALGRQREIGIRMALGAGRYRIVQQFVIEALLLTGAAAVAAVALTRVIVRVAEWLLFATMPPPIGRLVRVVDLSPDLRVLLFLATASVIAMAIFGVLPVLHAPATDLTSATRGTRTGAARPSHLRSALIAGQMTVCVLLLICAGVLLQATRLLGQSDPRFVTRGVWVIQLNQSIRPDSIDDLRSRGIVRATAAAWHAPFTGSLRHLSAGPAYGSLRVSAGYNFVSPEYFQLLEIPVIKGRNFTQSEAKSESAVAIVSEATAARFWPDQDPLGRSIAIGATGWQRDRNSPLPGFRTAQVVGVVRDVVSGLVFDGPDDTCVYFPVHLAGLRVEALLLRSDAAAEVTRRGLETFVEQSTQGAVLRVARLEEMLAVQVYPFRASFAVTSGLGGLATALTLSGIYGVVSFLVRQRRREIGIRMALGATSGVVVRGVLLESLRPVALGTGIGVLLALTASKLAASQLSTINAFDLPAYVCGIAIAVGSAGLAAVMPSSRAAKTMNPSDILRSE
jgi:putative ABC transport system permease protein